MSDIIPVFLGADLNCYNFARAFHEAYGVESYAYGRYPMAPTKYSKIVHFTTVPDMDNEDTMLRILHEFAAQHTGKKLYLFGCNDIPRCSMCFRISHYMNLSQIQANYCHTSG